MRFPTEESIGRRVTTKRSRTGKPVALIHYSEIALKRGNRAFFESALVKNIHTALGEGVRVSTLSGRMVVELGEGALPLPEAIERLTHVFGVANVAAATGTGPTLEAVRAAALELAAGRTFASFGIRARRAEKGFPVGSQEVNRDVGAAVQQQSGARVDLTNPELAIHIELLKKMAFVLADRVPGPSGLPIGTSGRVACLLSGGIDSPVAAWRMMKRGCRPIFIHFHSAPFTSAESQEKAQEIAERLMRHQPATRLLLVPFGELQKKIVTAVPKAYRVVLYRRFMLRIGCALAKRHRAQALVTGEALAQVASQTLANLAAIDAVTTVSVLRPLIGMDKEEIVTEARRIGTYETSIEPHDDCCSFLIPPHPVIHSSKRELDEVEEALDIDALVEMALPEIKEIRI